MPPHLTNARRSDAADAVTPHCDGGFFRLYTAPMPADADTPLSGQTVLAECGFASPAFAPAVNGVATAHPFTEDASASGTGDAAWFRCVEADGTTVVYDGTVGLVGSGADLEMNRLDVVAGSNVAISGFTYTQAR